MIRPRKSRARLQIALAVSIGISLGALARFFQKKSGSEPNISVSALAGMENPSPPPSLPPQMRKNRWVEKQGSPSSSQGSFLLDQEDVLMSLIESDFPENLKGKMIEREVLDEGWSYTKEELDSSEVERLFNPEGVLVQETVSFLSGLEKVATLKKEYGSESSLKRIEYNGKAKSIVLHYTASGSVREKFTRYPTGESSEEIYDETGRVIDRWESSDR